MKSKKIIFLNVFALTLVLFFYSTTAHAYNTFNDHTRYGQLSNIYFYIGDTANEYSTVINAGANAWNLSPVHHTAIQPIVGFSNGSPSNSSVYFLAQDFGQTANQNGIIAQTQFYVEDSANSTIRDVTDNLGSVDWNVNAIYVNTTIMSTLNVFNEQGSMCHELGHALGLAHNQANPYSIMCQLGYGRLVNGPGSDDVDGIKHLYRPFGPY